MNQIDINIEILEKRIFSIESSNQYSLVEIPGDKVEIFDYLIEKLKSTYTVNNLFNPTDFTMFNSISNFSVLHILPIQFFYKLLFETDILHPKVLAISSDEYIKGADINLLQAIYFYKTFYAHDMSEKEYNDTFTLLCLAEPNILLQPVDVEDELEFWDVIPFLEFCTKEGHTLNHIGKALSILEYEDKEIVKKFILSNIYNFDSFKPLLHYCSKTMLLEIPYLNPKIPQIIINDFFDYIYSRPPRT